MARALAGSLQEAPPSDTIFGLFEAQVRRTPDAPALEYQGRTLSYAEAAARANRLAHQLIAAGAKPGAVVGFCFTPALDSVVALLAILKCGAAFLPVDPDSPRDRMAFILADAGVQQVVSLAALRDRVPSGITVVCVDKDADEIAARPAESPQLAVDGTSCAWVVYTSGSTGQPKGVCVPHRAAVNHHVGAAERFGLRPEDRVHQFTPMNFDAAFEAIFPALCVGATVVLRPQALPGAAEFTRAIEHERLTVLTLPPAYLIEWIAEMTRRGDRVPASVRMVILGGERIPVSAWKAWQGVGGEAVAWFNDYGPTETTITAFSHRYCGEPLDRPYLPIGRPLPGVRAYVLDESRTVVAQGTPGELWIGGAGVSDGYLNRPELTADRFVPDPFAGTPGARMYGTGDQVVELPGGDLYFLGRQDDQVKIRGHRVELGEVEAVLRSHAEVKDLVVVSREDRPGDLRLVAYFSGTEDSAQALRQLAADRLPEYMRPAAWVAMERLPTTPNGKVDKRALPAPSQSSEIKSTGDDVASKLAAIWCDLLNIPSVSAEDDFFVLGGHSLMAMQLVARVQEEFGIELSMATAFELSVLSRQAEAIQVLRSAPDVDALDEAQVAALLRKMQAPGS